MDFCFERIGKVMFCNNWASKFGSWKFYKLKTGREPLITGFKSFWINFGHQIIQDLPVFEPQRSQKPINGYVKRLF